MNEMSKCVKNQCHNKMTKKGQKYILTQTNVQEYEYSYDDLFIIKERLENDLKMCKFQRESIDKWEKDTLAKLKIINEYLTQNQSDQ